jgi:predicted RNA binding protein YcfA (HicA-like mRNA interferase family)
MPKITPVSWNKLVKVFESIGFARVRQKGSHIVMVRPGCPRPLIIPAHKEVSIGVIQSCLRTADMSREDYLLKLENV